MDCFRRSPFVPTPANKHEGQSRPNLLAGPANLSQRTLSTKGPAFGKPKGAPFCLRGFRFFPRFDPRQVCFGNKDAALTVRGRGCWRIGFGFCGDRGVL